MRKTHIVIYSYGLVDRKLSTKLGIISLDDFWGTQFDDDGIMTLDVLIYSIRDRSWNGNSEVNKAKINKLSGDMADRYFHQNICHK